MKGYKVLETVAMESHINFIRIEPIDIKITLSEILASLSNLSWLSKFDPGYIQDGYQVRATLTIDYLTKNIFTSKTDNVTSSSGEYIVSELARNTLIEELKYLDIPLAELLKEKAAGNHGFDFFSKTTVPIILFGEAKYNASQNAYGSSFEQIVRFINEKRDTSDLVDVGKFYCVPSLTNFEKGIKGFVAAFSSKTTPTDQLIKNIKENDSYQLLKKHTQIICIAVNL